MAGSFVKELEDLLNPLPVFADPEDNDDEATKAKVTERLTGAEEEEEDEEGRVGLSALRRRNESLLADTDRRYVGKPVSREQLLKDLEGSEEEEEEDEEEEDEKESDEDEEVESSFDEEEEEAEGEDEEDITSPARLDFHKLTEGMDDLGMSEDDGEGSADEDEASGEEEDDDEEEEEEVEGGVQTFSQDKVDEEVEKGKSVRNQLSLWDQLLEGRIKIQRALVTANQLPQPDTLPAFKRGGGAEMAGALKTAHKALKALQRTLLELQDHLLYQNPETRAIAGGAQSDDDEEIKSDGDDEGPPRVRPPKRKLEMAEYPDVMAKRFAAFKPYCDATLQKWHDKTRLTTGKSGRGFAAFDRNIVTQVEQVLMDKERLLRRTRTRRSEYRVLGKKEAAPVAAEDDETEGQVKANQHLKDLDENIFDDDDFYHQLLRELIERRTSASDPNDQVAMGRQWLAIQKLRSKIKKKVDTKASKGRKVRFHVHGKLVNFMAPVEHGQMSDEARNELYRGLFGQNAVRE